MRRTRRLTRGSVFGRSDVHELAPTVVTVDADVVAPVQFAGGGIARKRRTLEGIVRTPHAAPRRGFAGFLYSHEVGKLQMPAYCTVSRVSEPVSSSRANRVTDRNAQMRGTPRRTVLAVRPSGATTQPRISAVTPWGSGQFGPRALLRLAQVRQVHHARCAAP